MPISGGDFVDIEDLSGSIEVLNGTVGTTPEQLPDPEDKVLAGIAINNTNTAATKILLISFDSFTTEWSIPNGSTQYLPLRGAIKSFEIKGAVADVDYEVILYKEAT